jgi:transposase, IS5 family
VVEGSDLFGPTAALVGGGISARGCRRLPIPPAEFERVIVDTTVQEKAIAHPVDSRLLEIARHKVARAAKRCAIVLKQTFANEGKTLRRKARRLRSCQAVPPPAQDRQAPAHDPGCAHARCAARAESNFAGDAPGLEADQAPHPLALTQLQMWRDRAERIRAQQRHDKDKLYALHAPEVECISKAKRASPTSSASRSA